MWGQQGMVSAVANCQANAWSKESSVQIQPGVVIKDGARASELFQKLLEAWVSIWKILIFSDHFFLFLFCSFLQHSISQTQCIFRLDPAPGLLVYNRSDCSSVRPQTLMKSGQACGQWDPPLTSPKYHASRNADWIAAPFLAAGSHLLNSHGTQGQVSNFKSSCKGLSSLPLHPPCATETVWCHVQGPQELWSFISQCRKNSARGKVIDKRWLIRIGPLRGLQAGWWEDVTPQELTGLQFYNQRKSGEWEKSFFVFLE